MAYFTLPDKAIRVSSVILRYLAKGRFYPDVAETAETETESIIEIPGGVSVKFADGLFHEFTYAELRTHSNYTDNTSVEYPFVGRVTPTPIRERSVADIVDYSDDMGLLENINNVGFCIASGSPDISEIAKELEQVHRVSTVLNSTDILPADHLALRSSGTSRWDGVDLRIVQGPFSGNIVNGLRTYSEIRVLEMREQKTSVNVNPRVLKETSGILAQIPVQEVQFGNFPRRVPVLYNNRFRINGTLPDARLTNFHEYICYYSNFLKTCQRLSVPISLMHGETLVYDNAECLTTYTGGSRVLEINGSTDVQGEFVDFMGAGVNI